MNRIIKFRAKRKLNGFWVYGSYIAIGEDWCQIIPTETEYDEISNEKIRVITETVGQFTSFTDKNCCEIYEGDILKFNKWIGKVCFGQCAFYILYNDNTESEFNTVASQELEIIGNIYDNPELLK